jgi:hypothetical protein
VTFTSYTCKNRPAVVVPVDYKVRISEKAGYDCDEERGYRGRILDEEPSRWLRAVAECVEETPNLP